MSAIGRTPGVVVVTVLLLVLPAAAQSGPGGQDAAPPRILLDQPVRAVEYQLNRLSNEQLLQVERRADDVRYRPVYMALLSRPGLAPAYREEALGALATMTGASASEVLIEALARVAEDQAATADQLTRLLLAQPASALRQQRQTLMTAVAAPPGATTPGVITAAYAAVMVADDNPAAAWEAAAGREGHLRRLLDGVPLLPAGTAGDAVRRRLVAPITALLDQPSAGADTRAAALMALAAARPDTDTFTVLARELRAGTDAEARTAAVRALLRLPERAWPADAQAIEALTGAILSQVGALPPDARTEPAAIDALQLGEQLAARLPGDRGRAVRRDLRALGVQVVRIETLPEQLAFNLRWFVVEAGKSVQIVLVNPDAMPHNLVVGRPGSIEAIGTAGSAMPMPADPNVKPFVPDLPQVLFATRLLNQGETERLGFNAPSDPGAYIYVCTFPGHWLRMYGVMLVVPSLDAWEAAPVPPADPMTGQPFPSQRQ